MEINVMKKLLVISFGLSLVACGGDSDKSDSSPDLSGGVSVNEVSSFNDNADSAQRIELNSNIRGSLGPADEFDYYELSVQEGQQVSIVLSGGSDTDLDIILYRNKYREVASSQDDYSTESITYTASSTETLHLEVEYYDGPASDYQLVIKANGNTDLGNAGGSASGGAEFCVETTTSGSSQYVQTNVENGGNTNSSDVRNGSCPTVGYVSKCSADFSGIDVNTYFSQAYVDLVGGHSEVRSNVCDVYSQQGATTSYQNI